MATQSSTQSILDHIVILVSHSTFLELPERLKHHFVISPGGEHAGGLTSNKLILFSDGVYIELIAFHDDVDPETRRKQSWGNSIENTIIDWAYTLPREEDFEAVQQRVRGAEAGITYADPVSGGRTRLDGTVLEWLIGAARDEDGKGVEPGCLPFWCLDRTPRDLRVPYRDSPESTRHPSGARGVSRLHVSEREKEADATAKVYNAIHQASSPDRTWKFHVPDGSTTANHKLVMSVAGEDGPPGLRLVLDGSEDSPSSMELLPGLVVDIEARGS